MAKVEFERGIENNLPTSDMAEDGHVYVSTDNGNAYIGDSQGGLLPLNRSPYYAVCSVDAEKTNKIATLTDTETFRLVVGTMVTVKFTNRNSAVAPALNVNASGAVPIFKSGVDDWGDGDAVTFVYDGTYWVAIGKEDEPTPVYHGGDKVEIVEALDPSLYTRLESAKNGESTSIETSFAFDNSDTEYEVRFRSIGAILKLFGSMTGSYARYFLGIVANAGTKIMLHTRDSDCILESTNNQVAGHIYHVKGTLKNGVATLVVIDETDGTVEVKTGTYGIDTTPPYVRFGVNTYATSSKYLAAGHDIFFLKLRRKGKTILEYIPVKRNSDDEVGFFDIVTRSFVGATTGSFSAGVSTVRHNDYIIDVDMSGKADKVANATSGNFASLDQDGNLVDSGSKPSDFITQHQAIPEYTVTKLGTAESGYTASYGLYKDGVKVGATINIPKDFLVKSGLVIDVVEYEREYYDVEDTEHDNPLPVSEEGKYLDFVVNSIDGDATDQHIYILVSDLVDVYTGGTSISISDRNVINVVVSRASGNGLGIGLDGLGLSLASYSTGRPTTYQNGAMLGTDKEKLDGIATGAEPNVQADWDQPNQSADDFIKNKPTIPSATSDLTNDSGFITSAALPSLPLSIAQGGTGKTTDRAAEFAISGGITEAQTAISDASPVVMKYASPSESTGAFYFRKAQLFWDYIKSKIASILGISSTTDGVPLAPTAAVGTDTTQVATTAFVNDAIEAAPQEDYHERGAVRLYDADFYKEYTPLESAYNSASTRYSLTYYDVDDLEFEIRYKEPNPSTMGPLILFGAFTGSSVRYYLGIGYGANSGLFSLYTRDSNNYLTSSIARVKKHVYTIKASLKEGVSKLYVLDENTGQSDVTTGTYTPDVKNNLIGLLKNTSTGTFQAAGTHIYYARLRKEGRLIVDYVPYLRKSDNAVGFINMVNGNFALPYEGTMNAGEVANRTDYIVDVPIESEVVDDSDNPVKSSALYNSIYEQKWRGHERIGEVDELEKYVGYINTASYDWDGKGGTNYFVYLPIPPNLVSVVVTAGSSDARVALMTQMDLDSNGLVTNGATPSYADGTSLVKITSGESVTVQITSDAKLLYVALGTLSDNVYSREPASLKFTGSNPAENWPLTIGNQTYDGSAPVSVGFATVATSGSYNDLSDKPTIPSISGLAVDADVVHKAGTETITGSKSFTKSVGFVGDADFSGLFGTIDSPLASTHSVEMYMGEPYDDGEEGVAIVRLYDDANVDHGGTVIIRGINNPIGSSDAANKAYVDAAVAGGGGSGAVGNSKVFYGTCSTGASTTAKVVTCPDFTSADLVNGVMILVYFANTNSGAVGSLTLNVNSTGAKGIRQVRNTSLTTLQSAAALYTGSVLPFVYNGAYWILAGYYYNSSNSTMTDANLKAGASTTGNLVTAKLLKDNFDIDTTNRTVKMRNDTLTVPNDTDLVHKSGTETVSGQKTFTSDVNIQDAYLRFSTAGNTNRAIVMLNGGVTTGGYAIITVNDEDEADNIVLRGIANPESNGDAVNKSYVDDIVGDIETLLNAI